MILKKNNPAQPHPTRLTKRLLTGPARQTLLVCFAILLGAWHLHFPKAVTQKATIQLKFENVQLAKGQIKVALYRDAETFLDTKKAAGFYSFAVPAKGSFDAAIENIEPGEYAIAVFHDENSNNQLETNLLGIPTEPYCFSGSGHSKWKPPVFENAKFSLGAKGTALTLRLEKWRI